MPFIARSERFGSVDSTQRVVRGWMDDGVPEVAVAVADEQTQGRGRHGRDWEAPTGAALLVSVGFRPDRLALRHAWRLAAVAALAMIDGAEEAAGLPDSTLWLKWPNDLVAEGRDGSLRKVAGVLGESVAEGGGVGSAVIGIGINADWRAADFPVDLSTSMTSLREISGGRPIDRDQLLDAYLARLEPRYAALLAGAFDAAAWSARQRTTGRTLEVSVGEQVLHGTGEGVDPESGALLLGGPNGVVPVDSGEVTRCRIVELPARRGR